ncbi:MAG: hypothetical protein AAGH78_10130 [Cyanobacteria bacterium P01_H01_bin.58]
MLRQPEGYLTIKFEYILAIDGQGNLRMVTNMSNSKHNWEVASRVNTNDTTAAPTYLPVLAPRV